MVLSPATTINALASTLCDALCRHPLGQIAENSGEDGAVVTGKILDSKHYAFGYNAQTGEYGDLVKQGVIDPAKVVRTSLQNASSVAGLLLATEAMVAEKPKPKAPALPPFGRHGRHGLLVRLSPFSRRPPCVSGPAFFFCLIFGPLLGAWGTPIIARSRSR